MDNLLCIMLNLSYKFMDCYKIARKENQCQLSNARNLCNSNTHITYYLSVAHHINDGMASPRSGADINCHFARTSNHNPELRGSFTTCAPGDCFVVSFPGSMGVSR